MTMSSTNVINPTLGVLSLPDELILHVLSYLDVPELLSTSRTNRHLRHLCLDPLLHYQRIARASLVLERSIPIRPSLVELVQHRIYISRTSLAARDLDRNLIKIKLNRSLSHRPSPSYLVEHGVLPTEYLQQRMAPSLISMKRRIEKERVKDMLRHRVAEWGRKASRKGVATRDEKPEVRLLVRQFSRQGSDVQLKGWGGGRQREMPTRAKVLVLKRFWEGVGKGKDDMNV